MCVLGKSIHYHQDAVGMAGTRQTFEKSIDMICQADALVQKEAVRVLADENGPV
jgi:hypothetical protein